MNERDVIKAINDFESKEIVNVNPHISIPYYVLDNMGAKLSRAIAELEKKDKIINLMAEQLTTPVHSKEWVIEHYKKEIEKV